MTGPAKKRAPAKAKKAPARKPARAASRRGSPAGRPRKYSAAVHRTIVKALEDANYRAVAFRLAGIHEDTGFEWLRLGRQDPEAYPAYARLAVDVERAEATAQSKLVSLVLKVALSGTPNTWQAAMTLLERRWPEQFSQRQTTVVEGGDRPLEVLGRVVIFDAEARSLSRDLLRRVAAPRTEQPGGPGVGDEPPQPGD